MSQPLAQPACMLLLKCLSAHQSVGFLWNKKIKISKLMISFYFSTSYSIIFFNWRTHLWCKRNLGFKNVFSIFLAGKHDNILEQLNFLEKTWNFSPLNWIFSKEHNFETDFNFLNFTLLSRLVWKPWNRRRRSRLQKN